MENINYKTKCEVCGKEIFRDEMIIVEEARVCNNITCIDEETKRTWNEGDKETII